MEDVVEIYYPKLTNESLLPPLCNDLEEYKDKQKNKQKKKKSSKLDGTENSSNESSCLSPTSLLVSNGCVPSSMTTSAYIMSPSIIHLESDVSQGADNKVLESEIEHKSCKKILSDPSNLTTDEQKTFDGDKMKIYKYFRFQKIVYSIIHKSEIKLY